MTYDATIFNHEYKDSKKNRNFPKMIKGSFTYKENKINHETVKNKRYSKTTISVKTKQDLAHISLGVKLHNIIETIDFKKDITSYIVSLQLDSNTKLILEKIKESTYL